MTRDQAKRAVADIELRIGPNSQLRGDLERLKGLVASPHFSTTSARTLVEKIMRNSPKKLRGVLYNTLYSKEVRLAGSKRYKKVKHKASGATATNIGAPWQGGAPGLGKRS